MANKIKPVVGVIYSDPEHSSSVESSLLAKYLAGLLFLGKYSSIRLIALPKDKQSKKQKKEGKENDNSISKDNITSDEAGKQQPQRSVSVLTPTNRTVVVVNQSSEFQMNCTVDILKDCHILLVCVNPNDSERTAKILSSLPKKDPLVGIFSLQYGCKNFDYITARLVVCVHVCVCIFVRLSVHVPVIKINVNQIKTHTHSVSATDHALFDGAVGFHVVQGVSDNVLRPLTDGNRLSNSLFLFPSHPLLPLHSH
jgi:hypothetical protein